MEQIRLEDMVHFAVVVDGEVATYVAFPQDRELFIAAYRSNPIFIEVPYDNKPAYGDLWDGEKFISSSVVH
jgi:hypothetical protein